MAHVHDGKSAYVRASSLDAVAKCPAMPSMCDGEVNADSDATELGQAGHQVMEDRAAAWASEDAVSDIHGDRRAKYLMDVARRHKVPIETLDQMMKEYTFDPTLGPEYCHNIHTLLVEQRVELKLGEDLLSVGHCDVATVYEEALEEGGTEQVVDALDYKTGDPAYITPPEESLQVQTYGVAMGERFVEHYPDLAGAYATIGRVRIGDPKKAHLRHFMDRGEWPDIKERIRKVVHDSRTQWDLDVNKKTFRTGDHCSFCQARYKCPAANADLKTFMAVSEQEQGHELTVDMVPTLFDMASRAARAAGRTKDILKEFVNGQPDGKVKFADDGGVERVLEERSYWQKPNLSMRHVEWACRELAIPDSTIELLKKKIDIRPEEQASKGLRVFKVPVKKKAAAKKKTE